MSGRSIEAVLRLNTVDFDADLNRTREALTKFRNSFTKLGKDSSLVSQGIQTLQSALSSLLPILNQFSKLVTQTKTFNDFSKGLLKMSEALTNFSNTTNVSQAGILRIKSIMDAWSQAVRGLTVNIRGLNTEESKQTRTMKYLEKEFLTAKNDLSQMAVAINRLSPDMLRLTSSEERAKYITAMLRKEFQLTGNAMVEVRAKLMQMEGATLNLGKATLLTSADFEKMAIAERQFSASTTQAEASMSRLASNTTRMGSSMARASTQTKGLRNALGSLRSMGMLVGSMIAYNFIHNLGVATTETINAKSEMEGYFKMLHFGTDQVDNFNRALDETVKKFPRLNKYALGETISSIGVEFELTTQEMEKAMPVVSMITSEYLRAGRNVNEASLAVKDILQGEFQRLSRETGVKGDQLKEAGWSGDKNDVMGLLEALEKVGKSRNWDTFVLKANSLNDAVLILQNRFSEWSADMVNAVQPTILSVFNNLLSVAQGFADGLGGVWEFLNSGTWESSAVNIGLFGGALLTVSQSLLMYRTNLGLVEASQLGVKRSIASLILGLKGEQVANLGVTNSIKAKILGLKASSVAENGVTNAIRKKILALKQEEVSQKIANVQEQLSTTVKERSALASELKVVQTDLEIASEEGLITATEEAIIQEKLHSLSKELGTGASLKQTIANEGLTASLYMLGTGEALATAETGALATAWGVLNGIFMLSPIGWITGAILALAGAIFVLTGGLDPAFEKMKQFNDVMKDTGSAQKEADQYLEQVKNDAGEASDEFNTASGEVKNFKEELQSASYWYKHSTTAFEGLDLTISGTSKDILGDYGISKEQAEEWVNNADLMQFGKKRYYKAEQVLNKQIKGEESNYAKDLKAYLKDVDEAGGDMEEAYGKMTGNYENLAKHSYIANTSDDWWEKSWNQLYAGMDQYWIDYDKNIAGRQKAWSEGDLIGAIFGTDSEPKKLFENASKQWTDGWKGLTDGLADWQKGARDFLKPLDDFGDEVNKFLNNPLGYLGVQGHIDNVWKEMIEPLIKGITEDFPNYISESLGHWGEVFDGIKKPFEDAWNNFWSFEWLPKFDFDIWSIFGFGAVSASDGSSDHPSFEDDLKDIGQWIQQGLDSLISDPLGTLGIEPLDLGFLTSVLFGGAGGTIDFTWAFDFINNNIITPITSTIQNFMADPVAFIGEMGFTISGLLDGLFGTDIFTNVMTWVNNSIINPFGTAIYNGIMQIPILSDILTLLGFTDQATGTSSEKGNAIAGAFGDAINKKIAEIPIVGDIAQMLGLIPSQNSNARTKGEGVGTNIKEGEQSGHKGTADNVRAEMSDVVSAISQKAQEVYNAGAEIGSQIWAGINSILDRHSPGFISREIGKEFGVDIPTAINDSGATAYSTAQTYAQNMYDGMNSVSNSGFGLGSMVGEYESDAQDIAMSSEMMGTDTTTAFNNMQMSVNASTSQMQSNVVGTYSQIQSKQATSLNSMKTQNLSAYNDMYLKSNQSLIQMRDSTSNVTHQMVNAWNHMKDQIVASANRLKSDSTSHFNQLSQTIGTFYGKIQNPSRWGAGHGGSSTVRTARSSSGRNIARAFTKHGAGSRSVGGGSKYNGSSMMTVAQAKKMLCPNGDCGNLFNGYAMTDRIDIKDFLENIQGEHGFGWSDWHSGHYQHIKTKSDAWSMKSPTINLAGGIPTDATFKVGEFNNGTPKVSFSTFQSIAGSIFSRIPYRHYYDSSWKGSWLGALQAGACNCSDGADALIALASVFGFSGYKQWGKWGKEGHFWAVINGTPMDTTAWQGGYGWTSPKVHGYGSPNIRTAHPSNTGGEKPTKTVNITVSMDNSVIYGVDDLDSRIQESVEKGLQSEFNDSYSVAI